MTWEGDGGRTSALSGPEPEPTSSVAYARAILNILEDSSGEKAQLQATQKAMLNILGDFSDEKARLGSVQKAILNILDDFGAEKARLEATQKAMLNLLEDFDVEKNKVASANLALEGRTEELTRSNAELEQFAYVASHDLQEPLRMVSAYVQLLEKRYKGHIDAQADKYIHYAVDGAKRMESLIGALLEYSRAGRELQQEFVDTGLLLDGVLATFKDVVEEHHGLVTRDAMPTIPCDSAQLARVFQNLIGNALKFVRQGVAPRVHISAKRVDGRYLFSVADNGIGIDPAFSDRIFVIFQRLHTRAEFPGTGIGLAICKKIVERLGGQIWFESETDKGTTFFFELPAGEQAWARPDRSP
ncbi:MAG: hypothetical protein HY698_05415 [Deltaproteobacteria bacterium]|nr:hypothetical protein [Deltaproteobacteria bacterium]